MERFFKLILCSLVLFLTPRLYSQNLQLALVKYKGGGDWYANPTSLTNLVKFCNQNLGTNLNPDYATVDVGSSELFNFPLVHLTGHGNVVFSNQEAANLRN
ncbi:MAG TPA: DUF4159 domain-containing protein, partial [Bacteroidales bacterium]|nr:DUF4159 domain-containing protein [Bacteroidales bacterium]